MAISKATRQIVYNKCGGHCGYCGKPISMKQMQVDHIVAHWHSMSDDEANKFGIVKGGHEVGNLMPSCARCNRWKQTYTVEQFRHEIQMQIERLKKYVPAYCMAKDYGLIQETKASVLFYFETIKNNEQQSVYGC